MNTEDLVARSFQVFEQSLRDRRREALTIFIGELIFLLQKEGCSFGDLLDAVGSWAYTRPSSQELIKHLENAATEARQLSE